MAKTELTGGRTPRVARARASAFDARKRERFLSALAATCNVSLAAENAGVSVATVYGRKAKDASFRAGWSEALAEAYRKLELMMLERAMNGTVKTVTKADGSIDRTHEYPNAIALTLLRLHRDKVSGARSAFVDGYLRTGSEIELKSFSGASGGEGGYAVPRELDAMVDATLKAISPIRAIANVVRR